MVFLLGFINTCMRTKGPTTYTQHKLELDAKLFQQLKALGLAHDISDLSQKMGKNHTYFACMRTRGYGLHLGSLVFLAAKFSSELNDSESVRRRAKLRAGITAINETIQAKCRIRELELHG